MNLESKGMYSQSTDDLKASEPLLGNFRKDDFANNKGMNRSGAIVTNDTQYTNANSEVLTDKQDLRPQQNYFLGIFWMFMCVVSLATSTTFAKLVFMRNPKMDGMDYLWMRSTVIFFAATIDAWYSQVNVLNIPKEGRFYLAMRCILGTVAMP